MKKTKSGLIAAGFLLLIGAALIVRALAANGWSFSAVFSAEYETRTVRVDGEFSRINVRGELENVVFVPSDDGECRVEFSERKHESHAVAVEEGGLAIELTEKGSWWERLWSPAPSVIKVYLPRKTYESLYVQEITGDVTLPAELSFDDIYVVTTTGDVTCRASGGWIFLKTGSGSLCAEELSAWKLDLFASTGRLEARAVACEGALEATVGTGSAALTDVECGELVSKGGTGSITLKNVTVTGALSIERSTGSVRFEECDAAELTVKTTTGSVTGALRSGKTFVTKTVTGSVHTPDTAGGRCEITTTTGSISIDVR